jgi:hypothetical protein
VKIRSGADEEVCERQYCLEASGWVALRERYCGGGGTGGVGCEGVGVLVVRFCEIIKDCLEDIAGGYGLGIV